MVANPLILLGLAILFLTCLFVQPSRNSIARLSYWVLSPIACIAFIMLGFKSYIKSAVDMAAGIFWLTVLVYTMAVVAYFRMK